MTTHGQQDLVIQTLARLIRRVDGMGLEQSDGTSPLALVQGDAIQALRLLGFGWNWVKQEPSPLKS